MKTIVTISAIILFCAASSWAGVTISMPTSGSTVTSPAHLTASASSSHPVKSVAVFVDGTRVLLTTANSLNHYIWMAAGHHSLMVQAIDTAGLASTSSVGVTVASAPPRPIGNIEDIGGWQWCTRTWNGQVCASGAGDAISWMAPHQTVHSLDGSSAEFFIGGSTGYSNALWWKSLGGGASPTHFKYDFWVFIPNPGVSQALEFDVNQSFSNGIRYVYGSECNFKGGGEWDVWDGGAKKWVKTALKCPPFSSTNWSHFVWNFERVNGQVHYISLIINGVTHALNLYLNPEKNYTQSGTARQDINVAFQMDGDSRQDPYHVWLDKVALTAW
jgi:hypothetical protein